MYQGPMGLYIENCVLDSKVHVSDGFAKNDSTVYGNILWKMPSMYLRRYAIIQTVDEIKNLLKIFLNLSVRKGQAHNSIAC